MKNLRIYTEADVLEIVKHAIKEIFDSPETDPRLWLQQAKTKFSSDEIAGLIAKAGDPNQPILRLATDFNKETGNKYDTSVVMNLVNKLIGFRQSKEQWNELMNLAQGLKPKSGLPATNTPTSVAAIPATTSTSNSCGYSESEVLEIVKHVLEAKEKRKAQDK